jgi:hypothetical protein
MGTLGFLHYHECSLCLLYTSTINTQFVRLHAIPWAIHIPPHIPQFCRYTYLHRLVQTTRSHLGCRNSYTHGLAVRSNTAQKSIVHCAADCSYCAPYLQLLRTLTHSHWAHSPQSTAVSYGRGSVDADQFDPLYTSAI